MPKHEETKPRIATAAKLARRTHQKLQGNVAVSQKPAANKKKK